MSRLAIFLFSLFLILPAAWLLAIESGEDSIIAVAIMGCFLWWVWPRPPKAAEQQNGERPAWQDAPEPRAKPDWTALEADVRALQKEVQQLRAEVTVLKSRLGQQKPARAMAMPQAARSEAEKTPPAPDTAFSIKEAFPLPPLAPEPPPTSAIPATDKVASKTSAESKPKATPKSTPKPKPELPPLPASPREAAAASKPLLPPLPDLPREGASRPVPGFEAEDRPSFKLPAFFTENLLLKAGIAILFLGLAFLLRYVSGHIHISIPMRYFGVVLAALALAYVGWRLRDKRRDYALAVQGAALAILYLTTLAALKLHHLVAPLPAVVLMAALSAALVALAVRQNAQVLAQVALVGALAAPVLTSSGNNHYLALFGYLALVNSAVAAIAWFRSWRSLNLIGLAGTVGIALLWSERYYAGQYFAAAEVFLFYHLLLYTLVVCFHARRQLQDDAIPRPADDAPLRELLAHVLRGISYVGVLDSGLLFASAFAAFALQYLASAHLPYGAAGSAAAFALFYGVAAVWAYRRGEGARPLFDGFAALAAVFATLAVPLAFDHRWAVATWGVQAALVYVFATRQQSPHGRLFALAVYALASLALLGEFRVVAGAEVILHGSLPNAALHLAAGMAILWARRDAAGARWESVARQGVLALVLLQMLALPLMLAPPVWAAASWGVQAALLYALGGGFSARVQMSALGLYALGLAVLAVHFYPAAGMRDAAQPLLEGPLWPVALHVAAGVALFVGVRLRAAPLWQDHLMLAALWGQSVLLPLAAVGALFAAPLMLLPALALAVLQYRRAFGLDAVAIAASTVCAAGLYLAFGVRGWAAYAALATLALALAWLVQRAPWQEETPPLWQSAYNRLCGWIILLAAIAMALLASGSLPWLRAYLAGARPVFLLLPVFAALAALGRYARWPQARLAALAFTPLLFAVFALHTAYLHGDMRQGFSPLGEWLLGLALALALHVAILLPFARASFPALSWLHALGFNGYPFALSLTLFAHTGAMDAMRFLALVLPALAAFAVAAFPSRFARAPRFAYHGAGALPLLLCLAAALLYYNLRHPGGAYYLPLFNVIELPTLFAAWLLRRWWRQSDLPAPPPLAAVTLGLAGAWLWVSMLILRVAHHYFGVAWNTQALLASFGVQAALSLTWAIGAIALMLAGSRRGVRLLWQSGALLMGVVILKLFVVELGDSGGIARIVSFIGVGVLLLAVSYFAPAPRKEDVE